MRDLLAEVDEEILCADGFDDAIIGYVERIGQPALALYDTHKCIQILMEDGLSEEEAWEHFQYNVQGSYVGEYTPAFATLFTDED
jgi:hypothetical protein